MPTPNEVDDAGVYGPMDIGGRSCTIAKWQSSTFEGLPLARGNWYHLLGGDGITTFGMIETSSGEALAYRPYQVAIGEHEAYATLNEAIRALVPSVSN